MYNHGKKIIGQSKEMEPNSTGPTNLNIFLYAVLSR